MEGELPEEAKLEAAAKIPAPEQTACLSENRWVAVCDVLGFSDLVRTKPLEQLCGEYLRLLEEARKLAGAQQGAEFGREGFHLLFDPVELAVFSDTILVWSDPIPSELEASHAQRSDDDDEEFEQDVPGYVASDRFIWTVCALIEAGILAALPLRVGIAFGPCVIDRDGEIYLGLPFVDAYEVEKMQEWIGAACHPSCLDAPSFARLSPASAGGPQPGPIIRRIVPTKADYYLDWTIDWVWRAGNEVEGVLRSEASRLVDEAKRRKWNNALEFFLERRP